MSVLVVIPTVIDHGLLPPLLQQVHSSPVVSDILVVDNGNCVPANLRFSKLKVERPGFNLDWLASCNLGLFEAMQSDKWDYVCLLNDDVHLSENFFLAMVESVDFVCSYDDMSSPGVIIPRYNSHACVSAEDHSSVDEWKPYKAVAIPRWIDGTCMFIPTYAVKKVGLLDSSFSSPGWGAEIDYSYRLRKVGLESYVAYMAMLWHNGKGGTSAEIIYGSTEEWQKAGNRQASSDLSRKYGKNWREILRLPPLKFLQR